MINGKRCIGILTSGGDSPGMNAAIRAIVRTAISRGMIPLGVFRGYKGLLEKKFEIMTNQSVSNIIRKGGTILFTARCQEFYETTYQKLAYENCIEAGMDGLVVIGGDGSFNGALALSRLGLPCIAIPGTIDNDIACTEYTIGFDTAMNTIIDLVDRLSDTSQSHHRCSVVEVMGRHAGHIALNSGVACGAINIFVEEIPISIEEVARNIIDAMKRGKHFFIIIVSEGVGNSEKIAEQLQQIIGIDTRATNLGHVQRGGSPTLRDRLIASQMGYYATELLDHGIENRVMAMKDNKIVNFDISEALSMKKEIDKGLYEILEALVG